MPRFRAEELQRVARALLEAAGAPTAVAEYVAGTLVESNLMGHDSHGVQLVPPYLQYIREGKVQPAAEPTILHESTTTAQVDGAWGFGQVAARFGMQRAIEKARQHGLAAVGIVRCNHVGRVGEYPLIAARAGMIGMVVVGGSVDLVGVAPYGGATRAFGTNPYAFAVPAGAAPPVLLDFATSTVAVGKLLVARAKGVPLAPGLILDKEGRPSTDPEDYFAGGTLLPFGGHKGYGLALLADLLAGRLVGADLYSGDRPKEGTFILVVDVAAFRPLAEFVQQVDERLRLVKAVPPAPGVSEVLIPGEPEFRSKAERERDGIDVPDATWQTLLQSAQEWGVDVSSRGVLR